MSKIELEMDVGPRVKTDHEAPPVGIELDMVIGRDAPCDLCGNLAPLNDRAQCRICFEELDRNAQTAPPSGLDSIVAESAENAAGKRNQTAFVAPTTVGNSDVPAVDSGASDAGIAMLREQAAVRRAQAAKAATDAQLRARAERDVLAIVPDPTETARPLLQHGNMIAGAVAAGHGVLVGWCGKGDMTRAKLCEVLASAGLPADWAPEAASARAQAGRAVGALGSEGYDVRAEKKAQRQVIELTPYDFRWTVGLVDHTGKVGDKFGEVALVCTLTADKLEIEGDDELAAKVQADYQERIGSELYRSSDVTSWVATVLKDRLCAVKYGVGWYVPRASASIAARLCDTLERVGWGNDWINPALPIATCDELSAGILRGLSNEVAAVMHRLKSERETAKTKEDREDIGPKRAATFLRELREIADRVAAYGRLLGANRVESMRSQITASIAQLENVLGEDDAGLVARFDNVWEEIELDRKRAGVA